jgi:thiol-disulfide isomerase/thioredoxin
MPPGAYGFRFGTFKKGLPIFTHPKTMDTFNSNLELLDYVKQHNRVMVLFCASWCPFCREFFPVFDRTVKKKALDKVLRVYIDDDDNPLWEDYSLESVPTAMLFVEGRETSRLDARLGFGLSEKAFVDWLKRI